MAQIYESPSVTVIYFVPLERLANHIDDTDRTTKNGNVDLPGDDFTPGVESAGDLFG